MFAIQNDGVVVFFETSPVLEQYVSQFHHGAHVECVLKRNETDRKSADVPSEMRNDVP